MTASRPMGEPRPLKLTLDDFARLHEAGAFDGYSKVELIEGALYTMNPQQTRHAFAKSELAFRLYLQLKSLGSDLSLVIEGTVAMPPRSAPEPDIIVGRLSPGMDLYFPSQAVSLVVEVSESSLRYDLGKKKRLYARQTIPEFWVFDLRGLKIHQFWSPSDEEYRESGVRTLGERVESVTIPGLAVESDGLI